MSLIRTGRFAQHLLADDRLAPYGAVCCRNFSFVAQWQRWTDDTVWAIACNVLRQDDFRTLRWFLHHPAIGAQQALMRKHSKDQGFCSRKVLERMTNGSQQAPKWSKVVKFLTSAVLPGLWDSGVLSGAAVRTAALSRGSCKVWIAAYLAQVLQKEDYMFLDAFLGPCASHWKESDRQCCPLVDGALQRELFCHVTTCPARYRFLLMACHRWDNYENVVSSYRWQNFDHTVVRETICWYRTLHKLVPPKGDIYKDCPLLHEYMRRHLRWSVTRVTWLHTVAAM
jgi:hypothetical protein